MHQAVVRDLSTILADAFNFVGLEEWFWSSPDRLVGHSKCRVDVRALNLRTEHFTCFLLLILRASSRILAVIKISVCVDGALIVTFSVHGNEAGENGGLGKIIVIDFIRRGLFVRQ